VIAQPVLAVAEQNRTISSDTARIKRDLLYITETGNNRNYLQTGVLDTVADYIFKELSLVCDTVYYQPFTVNGREYRNVIGSQRRGQTEKIIVGAHYDVAGFQAGADDNASGVAGLLELARLLTGDPSGPAIDFVAYTLEEPPFFKTEHMGSYVHAKSLHDRGEEIKGMICLDMIGYFDTRRNTQEYPLGFLKLFYGTTADYITVVQKYGNGAFGGQVKRLMKKQGLIKTRSFTGPAALPGVDFSDHLNYWKFGYSAVMITNTAFYRNANYHKTTDILETLDIHRMSLVVDEVYLTLKELQ
jgi:hypothetical protein